MPVSGNTQHQQHLACDQSQVLLRRTIAPPLVYDICARERQLHTNQNSDGHEQAYAVGGRHNYATCQ
jgi:hypothetical protein